MFTRDIKNIVVVGKGGMRWDTPLDNSNRISNYDPSKDATITNIKARLQDIKNIPDATVQARMLNSITNSIRDIKTKDDDQTKAINTEFDNALADNSGFSAEAQTKIKLLKESYAADFVKVETKMEVQKAPVLQQAKEKTTELKTSKQYIDSLYEGRTYNRIDINDAMLLVSKIAKNVDKDQVDSGAKNLLSTLQNVSFASSANVNSTGNNNKWTSDEGKKIKTELAKFGYNAGADEYADREIADLRSFIEKHLGSEVLKTGKVDPKAKELADKNFNTYELRGSLMIKPLDGGNLDSLLMTIADMGGVDQGQKADGVLRGMNSKKYEGWVSRLFTGGEWAQNQIISELQAYHMLKDRVKTLDQLKDIVVDNLATSETDKNTLKTSVDKIFTDNNPAEIKKLLSQYSSVAMNKVAQIRDPRAAVTTMAEHNNMVIDQATKSQERITKIKQGVESNPSFLNVLGNKVKEITTQNPDIPEKDIESLLSTWKTTFLSNPSLYIGPSINVANETVITRIVDQAGKVLSESKAQNRNTSMGAFLTLSTTLIGANGRLSENVGAAGGIGLTGIAGVDGVALQLGATANASLTVADKNQSLEPLKGNWVIAGSVGLSKELLRDGKVYPSIGVDLNWNSRVDAIKKENYVFKSVLGKLFDEKFQIKETGIADARNAINELKKRPNNTDKSNNAEENFAIRLLETNLAHLENVLNSPQVKNNTGTPPLKEIITQQWLSAVTGEFDVTNHKNNSGIELAGAHVGYLFIANILTLGLNFEHIQGAYTRSSSKQRATDISRQAAYIDPITRELLLQKKNELLSSGKIITREDGALEVAKGIAINIDPNSGITKTEINGMTTLQSAAGKKIDFTVSEHTYNNGLVSTSITVGNVQAGKDAIEDINIESETRIMELSKADDSLLSSFGISLSKNASRDIYAGARNGKMSDLIQSIEKYGKSGGDDTQELFNSLEKHSKILGLSMDTVKKLTPEQLHQLATVLIKFSWGAKGVMSGGRNADKLSFSPQMKIDAKKVFEKERALATQKGAPQSFTDAAKISENQIEDKSLMRTSLSAMTGKEGYSASSLLVVGTPLHHEKNKTGNITSLASNTEGYIYGQINDITALDSKRWMLEQSQANTEMQRKKFNTFIKGLNPMLANVEMTKEEYNGVMLATSQDVPQSFKNKLDAIKTQNGLEKLDLNITTLARFAVGRAGFPNNECFNLTGLILYPGLSLTIKREGKPAQTADTLPDGTKTGEVGNPFTDAATATLGFGLTSTTKETTNVVTTGTETIPGDTGTETETGTEGTGTETGTEGTGTETGTEGTGTETIPGDTGTENNGTGTESEGTGTESEGTGTESEGEK